MLVDKRRIFYLQNVSVKLGYLIFFFRSVVIFRSLNKQLFAVFLNFMQIISLILYKSIMYVIIQLKDHRFFKISYISKYHFCGKKFFVTSYFLILDLVYCGGKLFSSEMIPFLFTYERLFSFICPSSFYIWRESLFE